MDRDGKSRDDDGDVLGRERKLESVFPFVREPRRKPNLSERGGLVSSLLVSYRRTVKEVTNDAPLFFLW